MDKILANLIDTMESLLQCYGSLRTVLENEKQAMIHWNADKILECSRSKESAFKKIDQLEAERAAYTSNIVFTMGLPNDTTLSGLCEKLPSWSVEKLVELKGSLLNVINSVKQQNSLNSHLALKTTEFLGNFVGGLVQDLKPTGTTYSKLGKINGSTHAQVFNKSL